MSTSEAVLVAVCTTEFIYARAASSVFALYPQLPPGSEIIVRDVSASIAAKRNHCAAELLADDRFDKLWFIDNDIFLPPNATDLLGHDADIVGGLMRSTRERRLLECGWARNTGTDPVRLSDHPEFDVVQPPQNLVDPLDVDYCGAGCLVISRRILEQVGEPWFVGNGRDGMNEDWNFCLRAKRDYGARVLVDPRVEIVHLTVMGVAP